MRLLWTKHVLTVRLDILLTTELTLWTLARLPISAAPIVATTIATETTIWTRKSLRASAIPSRTLATLANWRSASNTLSTTPTWTVGAK